MEIVKPTASSAAINVEIDIEGLSKAFGEHRLAAPAQQIPR